MERPLPAHSAAADRENFWVFGYGSLMWRPGFEFVERQAARLMGFRRDMCLLSIHYRGTAARPGLVCGLMAAADDVCHGRAYRIASSAVPDVVAYLDARELITNIYHPQFLSVTLGDERRVTALAYVADLHHAQFVGHWPDAEKAAAIAAGVGSEGGSLDYLEQIVSHLDELGITDDHMHRLLLAAREHAQGVF
jgi:cation transport protein ChaC